MPGKWVGHAVLSNTFRHPAVLAKAATVLDHATGGRFILGLGAGWHEDEHAAVRHPAAAHRRADSIASSRRSRSSGPCSPRPPRRRRASPAPTRSTRSRGAVNLPPPLTPGGPPIWLGGQKPRGLTMAAALADGWPTPALPQPQPSYLTERRTTILREMEAIGRDPTGFAFGAQIATGADARSRAAARELALAFVRAGATHVILGLAANLGPEGLRAVAREVAEPIRDALG